MNSVANIAKYVAAALSIVGVIFLILILANGDEVIETSEQLQENLVNPYMIFSYILLIVPAAMMLIFSVWYFITHPNKGKRALIALIAFGAIFGIGYALSDGTIISDKANETWTRISDMGLYAFYIMGIGTVLAVLGGELFKAIKR